MQHIYATKSASLHHLNPGILTLQSSYDRWWFYNFKTDYDTFSKIRHNNELIITNILVMELVHLASLKDENPRFPCSFFRPNYGVV